MTNNECLEFIKHVRYSIGYEKYGQPLPRFNKALPLGNGCVKSSFDDIVDADIGILSLSPGECEISEYDFMKCYISLLHEVTHIYQRQTLLQHDDDSAKFVSLSYFAGASSKIYYEDNYFYMADEIAAQYSALKNGYNILCKYVGEEKANSMICNYVNKHINDEFIRDYYTEDYSSVDDIFDDYNKAFKASKHKQRTLDSDKYKELLAEDENYKYIDCVSAAIYANKNRFVTAVQNLNSGVEQDFYLTKLFFDANSGEYSQKKQHLKSISNLDFKPKLFGFGASGKSIRKLDLSLVTPDFSDIDFDTNFDIDF